MSRRFIQILVGAILCTSCFAEKRSNILFILVDDLRPELGCYGNLSVQTPAIDSLASDGITFLNAYAQQPNSPGSRTSIFSGLRPTHREVMTADYKNLADSGTRMLNQTLSEAGYSTWSTGKILTNFQQSKTFLGSNYRRFPTKEFGRGYLDPASRQASQTGDKTKTHKKRQGPAFESPDVPDDHYHDGLVTTKAIEHIQSFDTTQKPFFLTIGYKRPHLPFSAPKKYWDLYRTTTLSLAENEFLPENASRFFRYNYRELRNYSGIPDDRNPLDEDLSRNLIHGYYACVSFIDAQIGRLLDALKEQNLYESTAIVLISDHGWKLGEHGMWSKHTLYDVDLRIPLILRIPEQEQRGVQSSAMVEAVDLYPTFLEIAGQTPPPHLEGESLLPVVRQPTRPWKAGAFSSTLLNQKDPKDRMLAHSIRTPRYRYIEWFSEHTGEVLGKELFDYQTDSLETISLSQDTRYTDELQRLSTLLDQGNGWKQIAKRLEKN